MRYKFRVVNVWDELKGQLGDLVCNVVDTGDEVIFDFGSVTLTTAQENKLINLLENKVLLRGKLYKFVEKGVDVTPTIGGVS